MNLRNHARKVTQDMKVVMSEEEEEPRWKITVHAGLHEIVLGIRFAAYPDMDFYSIGFLVFWICIMKRPLMWKG